MPVQADLKSLIPAAYDGREQALVKHRLLEDYLEKLFLIIGMASKAGGPSELCYIDCFAGPWGDATEAMESTSIAISLRTLDTCRQKLASLGAFVKIRALYVEQKPSAFKRLKNYLLSSTPSGIRADCMQGDFVALRPDILRWAGPSPFCFFFIDPTGFTETAIPTLRPLLERPRSEFLINLMYDFVNRVMSMEKAERAMQEWLGLRLDLSRLDSFQRESTLLAAYRAQAKGCMPSIPGYPARASHARVLDPQRNRPKYHLVYLTSHPKGVIKFSEISEQVAGLQNQVRAAKREKNRERDTGTIDMFGPAELLPAAAVIRVNPDEVDRFWRNHLADGPRQIDTAAFADILERTGWFEKDLQRSLLRLMKAGRIVNRAAGATKRTAKPLHHDMRGGECLEWVAVHTEQPALG